MEPTQPDQNPTETQPETENPKRDAPVPPASYPVGKLQRFALQVLIQRENEARRERELAILSVLEEQGRALGPIGPIETAMLSADMTRVVVVADQTTPPAAE